MIKLNYLIGFLILTNFYSCKCDKKYSCGTLSDEGKTWLPQNINDSIKFVNANGQHFNFVVASKVFSPYYEAQACIHGEISCHCDYSCTANGYITAKSDSSINSRNTYGVAIVETKQSNAKDVQTRIARLSVFDFYGERDLLSLSSPYAWDSLIISIQLGNHTYSNVYTESLDTLSSYYHNKRIWKAYFEKTNGIVGFWDRQSQSLYYRE